eukprot:GHVS01030532.1.p1 GENE.GHVS01030532.1~~GHVS01030532.1.p1  ORF type:complete len:102 (+),score=3.00 GHVS01030532.1:200-505(+)
MMGSRIVVHTFTEMNLICGVSTRHTFAKKQLNQLARPIRSQIDTKPSFTRISDMLTGGGKGSKLHVEGDAYVNRQSSRAMVNNGCERGLWQWLYTWSQKHR